MNFWGDGTETLHHGCSMSPQKRRSGLNYFFLLNYFPNKSAHPLLGPNARPNPGYQVTYFVFVTYRNMGPTNGQEETVIRKHWIISFMTQIRLLSHTLSRCEKQIKIITVKQPRNECLDYSSYYSCKTNAPQFETTFMNTVFRCVCVRVNVQSFVCLCVKRYMPGLAQEWMINLHIFVGNLGVKHSSSALCWLSCVWKGLPSPAPPPLILLL